MYKNVVCLKGRVARFDVKHLTSNIFSDYINKKEGVIFDDFDYLRNLPTQTVERDTHDSFGHGAWHPTYFSLYVYGDIVSSARVETDIVTKIMSYAKVEMRATRHMILTFDSYFVIRVKHIYGKDLWAVQVYEVVLDDQSARFESALTQEDNIAMEMMKYYISNFETPGLIVKQIKTEERDNIRACMFELIHLPGYAENWDVFSTYLCAYHVGSAYYACRVDTNRCEMLSDDKVNDIYTNRRRYEGVDNEIGHYEWADPTIPTGSYIITGYTHQIDEENLYDWKEYKCINHWHYEESIYGTPVHTQYVSDENSSDCDDYLDYSDMDNSEKAVHAIKHHITYPILNYCYYNTQFLSHPEKGVACFYHLENGNAIIINWGSEYLDVFSGVHTSGMCYKHIKADLIYVEDSEEFVCPSTKILKI